MKPDNEKTNDCFESLARSVPKAYKILDYLLVLQTDFWKSSIPILVLSPIERDVTRWYEAFEGRLFDAIKEKRFLPIVRASDGEYRFLLGPQPPSPRLSLSKRTIAYLKYTRAKLQERRSGFTGQTAPGVSVGNYSAQELKEGRGIFANGLRLVMEHGLFAAHLQFAPKPFQEIFHPAFKVFLDKNNLSLNEKNYIPFYFVYLFLGRVATDGLLGGRRILFINNASDEKKQAIDHRFKKYGVHSTRWIPLSRDRSLYDAIELSEADLECDICILGGGVGKFNLIQRLAEFRGPVVDAGYYFEALF